MLKNIKKDLAKNGEVYFRVKVRPGASNSMIAGVLDDDTIKIDIKVKPEQGRANKELIKFLAKEFGVAIDNIKIISGSGAKLKLIKIIL